MSIRTAFGLWCVTPRPRQPECQEPTTEKCSQCGKPDCKPIGKDYMGSIILCTMCHHEWQSTIKFTT